MKNIDFGEVITAMVTPFKKDREEVFLDEAELLARKLLKNGTDSLLLTGSTGEDAQLQPGEKWDLLKRVRKYTPEDTPIIVSTGDKNVKEAVLRSQLAFELGADAVLISAPEYIKPPQEALKTYYSEIARAVKGKPIILYNIPSRTGTEILPQTVAELADKHENIVGIKQSFGNLDRVSEMKVLCPPKFQIYSGDDSLTLPMLALGAKGVISVASHLEGNLIKKMIREFKSGRTAKAAQIHQLLFPLYQALFMTTNPLPVKEALYQEKIITSPTLRTLGEMSKKDKIKLARSIYQFKKEKKQFIELERQTLSQLEKSYSIAV